MNESFPSSAQQPRFTEEEQRRLREIFAPTAQKYRARSRLLPIIFGIFAAIILLGMLLRCHSGWLFGSLFICSIAGFFIVIMQSSLNCPACRENLISPQLDNYCPECGTANLKLAGWFRSPHCDSCGKSLRRGRSRQYRIRACTHCGLVLDDKGL